MKVQGIVAIAVVAVAIAACGGGGGGGSAPSGSIAVLPTAAANATPTPTNGALPAGYAVDSVSISMAKGTYSTTSVRRSVQTVGAGTESIVFTLLQQNGQSVTGTAQVFGLVQTSPGCTVNPNTQALSCVLPVDAPIGQDVFLAQTYDNAGGSNGTGNLTGSGAVALSVGQNTSNTASIVLNAQVANVYVVSGNTFLGNSLISSSVARRGAQARGARTAVRGTRVLQSGPTVITALPVFVIAVDSSGNTILNPSAYNAPLYLQLAFDPYCGVVTCSTFGTADVTLTVTYGTNDPSPCTPNGTATASDWYQSFPLCSPSDSVVATESATGGSNPSDEAEVYGFLLSNQLNPLPAPTPTALPTPGSNSFAQFDVYYPTPSPVVTGNLPVNAQ